MENNVITQKFNFNSRHLYATSYQLPENADPQKVQQLSDFIATLRTEENLNFTGYYPYEKVYRAMQQLREDAKTDFATRKDSEEFVAQAARLFPQWEIDYDGLPSYFQQWTFKLQDGPAVHTNHLIKVYLSTPDHHNREIYLGLLNYFVAHFKNAFAAKFAIEHRVDTICIWLAREDFFALESYVKEHEGDFVSAIRFIPYRGKMGISRDLFMPGSYNQIVSEIIYNHLKDLPSGESVSVNEMYAAYMRRLFDFKDGQTRPKPTTAMQTVVTILESVDLIVGAGQLTDDHELLQSDTLNWELLHHAKSWEELRECAQHEYYFKPNWGWRQADEQHS